MSGTGKLNKALWTDLTRLKLLTKPDAPVKFILEHSPFDDYEDDEKVVEKDEYSIIGRIFPQSQIFNQGSYRIEIKITSTYPITAPEVRFLTKIYHPNIANDGKFCHQLLNNASRWRKGTTLVEVINTIVKHVDEPNPDYAINYEMGREYVDKRKEFDRKALETVLKYALPRQWCEYI